MTSDDSSTAKLRVQTNRNRRGTPDTPDFDADVEATLPIEQAPRGYQRHLRPNQFVSDAIIEVESAIETSQWYSFDVRTDHPIYLCVWSDDSYHSPDWGRPVEGGKLTYGPDMDVERPISFRLQGVVKAAAVVRDPEQPQK